MPGMSSGLVAAVREAVLATFPGASCEDSPLNVLVFSLHGHAGAAGLAARLLRDALTLSLNMRTPLVVALMDGELKKDRLPTEHCAQYVYECSPGTADNALVVTRLAAPQRSGAEIFAVMGRAKGGTVVIDAAEARRSCRPTQMMVGDIEHDGPRGRTNERFYQTMAQQRGIRDLAEQMITESALMVPQFRDVPQVDDPRPAKDHEGWVVRYVLMWDLDLPHSVVADIREGRRPLTQSAAAKVYDSDKCVKLALEQHYADSKQAHPAMTQRELLQSVPAVWELCQLGLQMARHMPGAVVHTSGNKGVHVKVRDAAGFLKVHTDEYRKDFGKKLTDFGSDYLLARAPCLRAAVSAVCYRPADHPDRAIHSRHGGLAFRSGGARKSTGVLPALLDDDGLDSRAFSCGDPAADAVSLARLRAADIEFFAWMVTNAPSLADAPHPAFSANAAPPADARQPTSGANAASGQRVYVKNSPRLSSLMSEWEDQFGLFNQSADRKKKPVVRKALRLSVQTPQYRNSEYVADPHKMDRVLRFAAANYLQALHAARDKSDSPPAELCNVPLNERYRRHDGAPMRFAIDVDDVTLSAEHLHRIAEIVDKLVLRVESLRPCTVMMVLESTSSAGKFHLVWPGLVLPQAHLALFAQQVQQDCNADKCFPPGIKDLVDLNIYRGYLRVYCSAKPDAKSGDLLHGCYRLRRVVAPSEHEPIAELQAALGTLGLLSSKRKRGKKTVREILLGDEVFVRCGAAQAAGGDTALSDALVTLHRYCALTPSASGQKPTLVTSLLEEETRRIERETVNMQRVVATALVPLGSGTERIALPAKLFNGPTETFAAAAAATMLRTSLLATPEQKALLDQPGALVAKRPETDGDGNLTCIVQVPLEWVACNIKGGDHQDGRTIFCRVFSRTAGPSGSVQWFVQQCCLKAKCKQKAWDITRMRSPRYLCVPCG